MADSINHRPTGSRRTPISIVFVSMAIGMTIDRYLSVSRLDWLAAGCSALALWCVLWRSDRCGLAEFPLALAIVCLGGVWHDCSWRLFQARDIARFAGDEPTPICVRVRLSQSPRVYPAPPPDPLRAIPIGNRSQFRAMVEAVRGNAGWEAASGETVVALDGELKGFQAGDRVEVLATIRRIGTPMNPGERDFLEHQRGSRHWCQLHVPHQACIRLIYTTEHDQGASYQLNRWLDSIRRDGLRLLDQTIGSQESGLASAVLLGNRELLAPEEAEAFLATGTIHMLAISGMNVGILVYGFWMLSRFGCISRRLTLTSAAIFVTGYALLTDAEAPIVRAAVLVIVVCWANWIGRSALDFNTLATAGVLVLIMNPSHLFNVGSQLSFLAVATLASITSRLGNQVDIDPLEKLLVSAQPWVRRVGRHWLANVGVVIWSCSIVWVVTTPLVWYRFQLISPSGIVLNPLTWIPIAVAMYSGFGVLVLGNVFPPAIGGLGWICGVSLRAIHTLIDGAMSLPGSYCWLPAPPLYWIVLFYVVTFFVAVNRVTFQGWWRRILIVVGLAIWFVVGVYLSPVGTRLRALPKNLTCTFLAVGHGGAAVVEYPDGRVLLYDAGRMSAPSAASQTISGFLWSRGIIHIDAIVVSHADTDHFNAIPGILKRFSVGTLFESSAMARQESESVAILHRAADMAAVPRIELAKGDCWIDRFGVTTRVLHPPPAGVPGSDNANSVVLTVETGERRVLLTGDLEGTGLRMLLNAPPLHHAILMAPHHGSTRSDSYGLSRWGSPLWVVICGDRSSHSLETSSRYSANGSIVLHTAYVGAVTLEFEPDRIRCATMRSIH